jgi:chromosome segregation ATPase
LNGKTDLLGRAKELSEFVKRGETKATIEITLKRTSGGGDEVDVVKRTLTKAKGGTKANTSSAWHINGQPSNSAEVDMLVKGKHHVELGNLTNFLPQDKVASFAGLSETDKLSTTETTVNNGELWKLHEELIAKKENIRNDERKLSMLQQSLDQNARSLHTLSADKEKVEKQQEFQTKAEEYKMKIPWIRFEKKKVEFSKIKEKYA